MIAFWCTIATILAAIAYRMGGASGYNTKYRDLGVPFIATAFLFLIFHPGAHPVRYSVVLFVHFGLLFGALTTYWHFNWNGKKIMNFWLHGFMCGVAAAPIACATGHWWLFLLRCAILGVWAGGWSMLEDHDVEEESGRLLPLVPTLFMLL